MSAKCWVFTLNNYTEQDEQRIQAFATAECRYLVYGRERAPQTGTLHLQGYAYLKKRRRVTQLRRELSDRAHYEKAKGTPLQNKEYCTKDGDYYESGLPPSGQGRRTDLESVHRAIREGHPRDEIIELHFTCYARHHRFLDAYISSKSVPRTWATENVVYWGKTGTGKTRQVYNFHRIESIYKHTGERWFDGYRGQPVVLFDDFTGAVFPLPYLLQLIDRYPMEVPVKGGFVNWAPKTIYFTSNINPDEWYANAREQHQEALKRRLNVITKFE